MLLVIRERGGARCSEGLLRHAQCAEGPLHRTQREEGALQHGPTWRPLELTNSQWGLLRRPCRAENDGRRLHEGHLCCARRSGYFRVSIVQRREGHPRDIATERARREGHLQDAHRREGHLRDIATVPKGTFSGDGAGRPRMRLMNMNSRIYPPDTLGGGLARPGRSASATGDSSPLRVNCLRLRHSAAPCVDHIHDMAPTDWPPSSFLARLAGPARAALLT